MLTGGTIPPNGTHTIDISKLVSNIDYSICCQSTVSLDKSNTPDQAVINISSTNQSYNYLLTCKTPPTSVNGCKITDPMYQTYPWWYVADYTLNSVFPVLPSNFAICIGVPTSATTKSIKLTNLDDAATFSLEGCTAIPAVENHTLDTEYSRRSRWVSRGIRGLSNLSRPRATQRAARLSSRCLQAVSEKSNYWGYHWSGLGVRGHSHREILLNNSYSDF